MLADPAPHRVCLWQCAQPPVPLDKTEVATDRVCGLDVFGSLTLASTTVVGVTSTGAEVYVESMAVTRRRSATDSAAFIHPSESRGITTTEGRVIPCDFRRMDEVAGTGRRERQHQSRRLRFADASKWLGASTREQHFEVTRDLPARAVDELLSRARQLAAK